MSWRINNITIENFKFFHTSKCLQIKENNLLVYGENGSGKSSISEGIQYVFQSRGLTAVEAQKPFVSGADTPNKRNIYSTAADASGVSIEFTDKQGHPDDSETRYVTDTKINTQSDKDSFFKLSVHASDFLTYKNILSLSDLDDSLTSLFDKFVTFVFPYFDLRKGYKLPDGSDSGNLKASEWWSYILSYMASLPKQSGKRHNQFDRTKPQYRYFEQLLKDFRSELKFLTDELAQRSTKILNTNFEIKDVELIFNVDNEFVFNIPTGKGSRHRDHKLHPFNIGLSAIIKNDALPGGSKVVENPKIFFNEARLSCIGLALRFAVVDSKFTAANCAPLLVIDDLLISLDMCYRLPVIRYMVDYANRYQLYIFTHDRSFYDLIKNVIIDKKQDNWKFIQMYRPNIDTLTTEEPAPNLFPDDGYKEQAKSLLKGGDYLAAANYLRKYAEEQVKLILPENLWYNEDDGYSKKMLSSLCGTLRSSAFLSLYSLDIADIPDITSDISRVLNPLSHDDRDIPIFRKELEESIQHIEKYEIFANRKHIICKRSEVKNTTLRLYVKQDARYADLTLKIRESWDYFLMPNGDRKYKKIDAYIKASNCSAGVYCSPNISMDIKDMFSNVV